MKNVYIPKSENYKLADEAFDSEREVNERYSWVEDLEIEVVPETEYLISTIPPEFRSVLSYMAYQRGHSAGEEEVNLILRELISDLKPAIEAFEKRIKG